MLPNSGWRALLELADLERAGLPLLEATVATGFSAEVATEGLKAEFDAWTSEALDAAGAELAALDSARFPESVLIIAPRTLPASTLRQCLFARMMGATVRLKPASGQGAIARAIAAVDPGVSVTPFSSNDPPSVRDAVQASDTTVVQGGDEAVQAVRAWVPPGGGFVGYGHKVSAAWLSAYPTEADLVGLAYDLCAWDQAGCLSPQVAWVEAPGDVDKIAGRLAGHLRQLEQRLPMAATGADLDAARYPMLTLAEMAGTAHKTQTALVAALANGTFRFSPAPRSLWLLAASHDVLSALGMGESPTLSSLGIGEGVAAADLPIGAAVRRCSLGAMQRPPLDWQHDGAPNFAPMMRPLL